ncbi:MAG: hypothetical protein ACE5HQ_11315 [Gemmatimonadota bacterium]
MRRRERQLTPGDGMSQRSFQRFGATVRERALDRSAATGPLPERS